MVEDIQEWVNPPWSSRTVNQFQSGTFRNQVHTSDYGCVSIIFRDMIPAPPLRKRGVKLYKALPLGTVGRSLADQFSEEQICSDWGFDLIVDAIRHHFRSFLEAEQEVQAEVALYQATRTLKGLP